MDNFEFILEFFGVIFSAAWALFNLPMFGLGFTFIQFFITSFVVFIVFDAIFSILSDGVISHFHTSPDVDIAESKRARLRQTAKEGVLYDRLSGRNVRRRMRRH